MIRHTRLLAIVISAVVFALVASAHPSTTQAPPTSGGPVEGTSLEDLVAANRILAHEGIVDAYGHVSVRHPGDPNRYLLSRALAPVLVTAPDIIDRLHREIVAIVALPDVRERLAALGFEPIASTPKEFAARITWEIDKWAKVILAANIKAQ